MFVYVQACQLCFCSNPVHSFNLVGWYNSAWGGCFFANFLAYPLEVRLSWFTTKPNGVVLRVSIINFSRFGEFSSKVMASSTTEAHLPLSSLPCLVYMIIGTPFKLPKKLILNWKKEKKRQWRFNILTLETESLALTCTANLCNIGHAFIREMQERRWLSSVVLTLNSKFPVVNGHRFFHLRERMPVWATNLNVKWDRIVTWISSGNWLIRSSDEWLLSLCWDSKQK